MLLWLNFVSCQANVSQSTSNASLLMYLHEGKWIRSFVYLIKIIEGQIQNCMLNVRVVHKAGSRR